MQATDSSRPLVSFCMTTRNRPELLLRTLRSIQQQTVRDFEVLLADNDMAATARPVVASLQDERFQYHLNEADLGMIKSFNRSLSRARGVQRRC